MHTFDMVIFALVGCAVLAVWIPAMICGTWIIVDEIRMEIARRSR
jgi:hypothetical protein